MAKAVTSAIKNKLGGVAGTKVPWLSIGLSTMTGVSTFNSERRQGKSAVGAIASGVVDGFLADVIGMPLYIGAIAARGAGGAMVKGYENMAQKSRSMQMAGSQPFSANTFMESEQTYTMRQAGMNMIANSSMSSKKALLGSEAQMFHR